LGPIYVLVTLIDDLSTTDHPTESCLPSSYMIPMPIDPTMHIDDGEAILVYMWDKNLHEWADPEVAYWDSGSWIVAGQPVDWPTHWLPLPKPLNKLF
jgi:hypothetical protein